MGDSSSNFMKKVLSFVVGMLIGVSIILAPFAAIEAAVKVKGYYRKDGTYVQPHYRSAPDSNPFNNYSFPGNTNPYTGKTATGNVDTYLKNYANPTPSLPALPSLPSFTAPTPTQNLVPAALPALTAPLFIPSRPIDNVTPKYDAIRDTLACPQGLELFGEGVYRGDVVVSRPICKGERGTVQVNKVAPTAPQSTILQYLGRRYSCLLIP